MGMGGGGRGAWEVEEIGSILTWFFGVFFADSIYIFFLPSTFLWGFYSETCIHPLQYTFHSLSHSFTSLEFYKAFLVGTIADGGRLFPQTYRTVYK